jgi:hypothetical protein
MPTNIRVWLTVVVALVGAFVVFVVEGPSASGGLRWFAALLAVALGLAVWLFPEAKRGDD